jgi:hypothetical protein
MRTLSTVAALLACLGVAACGGNSHPHRPANVVIMLYSPNGEPLNGGPLGNPGCEDALKGWFRRTDPNGAGTLSEAAFLADAQRQFAAMDLDHRGFVTPETLGRYRAPYLGDLTDGAKHLSVRESTDQPDPVMSADSDLDNKVTRDEFLGQASMNFRGLDHAVQGRLGADVVTEICKARAEE